MGTAITYQNIDTDVQKLQELKKRQKTLRNQLQGKQFAKGDTVAEADRLIYLTGKESKEQLLKGITEMFKQYTQEGFNTTFEIIANKLHAALVASKTINLVSQEFRAYPLITKGRFLMVFINYYMEKLAVKMGNSSQKQIVMMNTFKIVKIPPPKTKYELGSYLLAAGIQNEEEKQKIMKMAWISEQSKMNPEDLKKQNKRLELLKKLRQSECD